MIDCRRPVDGQEATVGPQQRRRVGQTLRRRLPRGRRLHDRRQIDHPTHMSASLDSFAKIGPVRSSDVEQDQPSRLRQNYRDQD